jgi:transposase
MHVKTILRRVYPIPGFVYGRVELSSAKSGLALRIAVHPRKGSQAICSGCGKKRPGYDKQPKPREFSFVPLWALVVTLVYTMRRVDCPRCNVTVEMVPWATGKSTLTHAYCWFLADWANVLSWKETARRFRTSWDIVFGAVDHAVRWGLEHRSSSVAQQPCRARLQPCSSVCTSAH